MKHEFRYKIRCPSGSHEDKTPSCAVYSDGSGYCFSCNTYFNGVGEPVMVKSETNAENIEERIKYVKSLPQQRIRGLLFHFDNTGYYIIWPNDTYYKCRSWSPTSDSSRYISPRGHTQPLFVYVGVTDTAIIVEGEINAMSIKESGIEHTIISPGSAGMFTHNNVKNYLPALSKYNTLVLIADADKPGVEAVIKLSNLLVNVHSVIIKRIMEKDANYILTEYGKETLKKKVEELVVP